MKEYFLEKSMKIVSDTYPYYNDDKLDEIRYGLEAIYLSITKISIILFIAFLLGIFKATFTLLVFFNLIRFTGFGMHAKKSWICLTIASVLFIIVPYLFSEIVVANDILAFLSFFCIISFLLFAPADTEKRPIIKKSKRVRFKIITLLICFIYIYFIFTLDSNFMKNALIYAMIIESVLINPVTYKLFKLSFNNYKEYEFSTST